MEMHSIKMRLIIRSDSKHHLQQKVTQPSSISFNFNESS